MEYRTQDIMLAALLNVNFGLPKFINYDTTHFLFAWEETPYILKMVEDWNNYSVMTEPRRYYSSLKQLKSMSTQKQFEAQQKIAD